eukprot:gene6368-8770_t
MNYFSIDAGLIALTNELEVVKSDGYERAILFGLEILEGYDVTEKMLEFAEKVELNLSQLNKMCVAISALIWECAKLATKDISTLQDLLLQLGLSTDITTTFIKVYSENKRRIIYLKGSLGISTMSYMNLAWRLDVELARRSVLVTSTPKYMLRLDLVNNSSVDNLNSEKSKPKQSFHLQSDYSNLKKIQIELQRAVDEFNNVHCQRLNKYIT